MEFNEFQSSLEDLNLDSQPIEVKEMFMDFLSTVPYIQNLVSPDRKYARDLPRDDKGRIIVDITHPHILEDMDYFRPAARHFEKYGCYTKLRPNPNPNSEFFKWAKEEVRRCHEGYIRKSDGEWIPGDYYYFLNYAPMAIAKKEKGSHKAKRVMAFPNVWEGHYLQFHYLYQARENGHHGAELASRGKGKAHPYDEVVFTPEGLKQWKDIKIGDTLFDGNRGTTKVIDIPFDDKAPIYEIELANGQKVKCSEGHLWLVKSHCRHKVTVLSTKELLSLYKRPRKKSQKNPKGYELDCTIPCSRGAEFSSRPTRIDPYTFGLLLGDGCFRVPKLKDKTYFTSSEEDFEIYKKYIPYNWVKYSSHYTYNLNIPNFGEILKEYGLYYKKSEDKFIPDEYKFNTREVRINVLKGILDSDGTVTNGKIELCVTSKKLIEDVKWLLSSLGINYTKEREKHPFYYNKKKEKIYGKTAYRLSIFSNVELFNLPRKLQKWELRSRFAYCQSKYYGSKIVNIKYIGEGQCKCVTVDSPLHCYLINNFIITHNSFSVASLLAKRFNLGESEEVNKKVTCYVTASEKKYLVGGDQTLDKFKYDIDFTAQNTEWPSNRLINSLQNMQWIKGYTDMETKTDKGTLNSVIGITSKDDESKLRGSRGVLYILEEFGSFPRLLNLYQNLRPSVEDGRDVFGLIFMIGTAGDNESDFSSAQEIIYSPIGYNVQEVPNIYDKRGQGRPYFVYFFPEYLNRANCYNENGVSNVTKALLEICQDRYKVKNETTDVQAITKSVAERPVVPQEALLRTRGNMFPVVPLTERLNQLDNNPSIYDDVICGNLVWRSGEPQLQISQDKPIRQYPLKDNKAKGIIEIFQEPEFMPSGQPYIDRYIIGHDPVDDDSSRTMSLTSTFVLDLFTDQIVAEYTGRQDFADANFEIVRLLCLYYHGKCLYEQNKKGIFAYFSRMNCLHLLADTPEYLRDKQLIKEIGWGNKSKGVNATLPVNNFANQLIKEWLMKPVPMLNESGEEVMMPNLYRLRNRALIEELIQYNEFANFDRVRALGMVMLYREEKMILYQGDAKGHNEDAYKNPILNDPFFSIYDDKLSPDSQKIIGDQ